MTKWTSRIAGALTRGARRARAAAGRDGQPDAADSSEAVSGETKKAKKAKKPPSPSGEHRFAERDRTRLRVAEPHLSGHGAEVGAGGYPALLPAGVECDYFDKRSRDEMLRFLGETTIPHERLHAMSEAAEVHPNGADFLIAHNVLEHIVDPIAALIEWHAMVRDGGVVVLSVPEAGYGPDKRRLPVTFEHVLFDYLLERRGDERDFETREHVFGALSGFNKGPFKGEEKIAQAQTAFAMATSSDLVERDVFWHVHVFTPTTFAQTIHAAAAFGGRRVELLAESSPNHEDPTRRNEGEIIFVYRLHGSDGEPVDETIADAIRAVGSTLDDARERLAALKSR